MPAISDREQMGRGWRGQVTNGDTTHSHVDVITNVGKSSTTDRAKPSCVCVRRELRVLVWNSSRGSGMQCSMIEVGTHARGETHRSEPPRARQSRLQCPLTNGNVVQFSCFYDTSVGGQRRVLTWDCPNGRGYWRRDWLVVYGNAFEETYKSLATFSSTLNGDRPVRLRFELLLVVLGRLRREGVEMLPSYDQLQQRFELLTWSLDLMGLPYGEISVRLLHEVSCEDRFMTSPVGKFVSVLVLGISVTLGCSAWRAAALDAHVSWRLWTHRGSSCRCGDA